MIDLNLPFEHCITMLMSGYVFEEVLYVPKPYEKIFVRLEYNEVRSFKLGPNLIETGETLFQGETRKRGKSRIMALKENKLFCIRHLFPNATIEMSQIMS